MTPLQFAKEQCSNYQSDGSCLGIGINNDGSPYSFGRKARCVLSKSERCHFFEECVLPTHRENPILRQQVADVKADYLHSIGVVHKGRVCPQCQMRILEPRRRLCGNCAAKNIKAVKHAKRNSHKPGSNGGS